MSNGASVPDRAIAANAVEPVSRLDPNGLLSLAQRCEAATGPSHGLDCEIALASGLYVRERRDRDRQEWFYPTSGKSYGRRNVSPYAPDRLARFTASLDAAMTLVPQGRKWEIVGFEDGSANALVRGGKWFGNGSSPALAICAAALRARAAIAQTPGQPSAATNNKDQSE